MFGFGKKQIEKDLIPAAEKKKELSEREIFSADEAKEMSIEARNKRRNGYRKTIFKQVKDYIMCGYSKMNLATHYFDDGNDIYFEGLGFKVKTVWIDSMGREFFEEPTTSHSSVPDQGQQTSQVTPAKYIQISWE
jgi:hypothetical protein